MYLKNGQFFCVNALLQAFAFLHNQKGINFLLSICVNALLQAFAFLLNKRSNYKKFI